MTITTKPLIILVSDAAQLSDLDEALIPIQDALGVTDGGYAGEFFMEHDWAALSAYGRISLLTNYIRNEVQLGAEWALEMAAEGAR